MTVFFHCPIVPYLLHRTLKSLEFNMPICSLVGDLEILYGLHEVGFGPLWKCCRV